MAKEQTSAPTLTTNAGIAVEDNQNSQSLPHNLFRVTKSVPRRSVYQINSYVDGVLDRLN